MGGRGNFKVKSDDTWSSVGGYMSAKVQKLEHQFNEKTNNISRLSNIFDKVAIFVNGYTNPTNDELKHLMAQHGGKFHNYYSSLSTTHVIASNLPHAKLKELKPNENVVQPQWITDSIEAGKLLPIHPYLVVLHKANANQKTLSKFINQPTLSETSTSDSSLSTKEDLTANCGQPKEETAINSVKSHTTIVPTANSSFLSDFYSHSRLHFLSTWKTELAEYVRSLTISKANELTGLKQLLQVAARNEQYQLQPGEQFIVHIDMDCFFVSVGLLSRPHLEGKAIAVTHHQTNTPSVHLKRPGTDADYEMNYYRQRYGRNELPSEDGNSSFKESPSTSANNYVPSYSEIASCNYKAREAGLKNGMFYGKAKELCPELIAISYDFDEYRQTSQKLYDVLASYTLQLEAVSCDEALLDITDVIAKTRLSPSLIVQHIRKQIKEETGCNASAGIGPNIVLARMATRMGKPNGQFQVKPAEVRDFLKQRPVKNLPGVGSATAHGLEELGARTCGDLLGLSLEVLKKEFGIKTGLRLHNFALGIDTRKVCSSKERKSVSADVNYGIRLSNDEELNTFLTNLSQEVSNRLKKLQLVGKKFTLKVMVRRPDAPVDTAKFGGHGICQTLSRSKSIHSNTDDYKLINSEVSRLMKSLQVNVTDLRGIGIQVTQLSSIGASAAKPQAKTIIDFVKPLKSITPTTSSVIDLTSDEVKDDQLDNEKCATLERLPENAQCEISSSFLEALPDDLRIEVTKDWKAHRLVMETNKRNIAADALIFTKRNSPTKPKRVKSVRFKSPAKRKRAVANQKSANTSPNKLITDMFSPVSKSNETNSSEILHEKVCRKLIDDNQMIPAPDDEDAVQEAYPSPPTLGGASTISDSRDAVRRWTRTFLSSPPEEEDINEVTRYLCLLVQDSHDIEGACLILHTLRRSLIHLIESTDVIDTQIDRDQHVKSWISLYNRIASSLTEQVKEIYNGALLNIKFMA